MNRVVSAVLLVFTGVLAVCDEVNAQGFDLQMPPEKTCKIFLSERFWGTDWNSVSISRKIYKDIFCGASHDGWSDWRQNSAHLGSVRLLFRNEKAKAQTWTALAISRHRWPVVDVVEYDPSMALGINMNLKISCDIDSLLLSGACLLNDARWQWQMKSTLIKGQSTVIVLLGSLRYFHGWSAEYRYCFGSLSVVSKIEGPRPSFLVGLRLKVHSSEIVVSQRSRAFSSSSEVEMIW